MLAHRAARPCQAQRTGTGTSDQGGGLNPPSRKPQQLHASRSNRPQTAAQQACKPAGVASTHSCMPLHAKLKAMAEALPVTQTPSSCVSQATLGPQTAAQPACKPAGQPCMHSCKPEPGTIKNPGTGNTISLNSCMAHGQAGPCQSPVVSSATGVHTRR
jgi:hypothetical protein